MVDTKTAAERILELSERATADADGLPAFGEGE